MGFFGKKEPARAPVRRTGLAAPVVVQPGDVDKIRHYMEFFEQNAGNATAMRGFGRDLNQAGGFTTPVETVQAVQDFGADVVHRPWFWLAAVARAARAEGDHLLVASIGLCTWYWENQVAPNLRSPDILDGIVAAPPPAAKAEIHTAAFDALPGLSPDTVVMANPTGTLRASDVLVLVAKTLTDLADLLDAALVARARSAFG